MKFITTLAVTFFAGMGAGLGTGFAGMSAAAVIAGNPGARAAAQPAEEVAGRVGLYRMRG